MLAEGCALIAENLLNENSSGYSSYENNQIT